MAYNLFELKRTMKLGAPADHRIAVSHVASRCTAHHSMLACCLSNNVVVLKYTTRDGTDVTRTLTLGNEMPMRIEALDFEASAEWLLCITHDGSCHVVPALAMLAPDESPNLQPAPGPLDTITKTNPIKALSGRVLCCAWWRTLDGANIAVVGSRSNTITFVDLTTSTVKLTLKTKSVVHQLDIVSDRTQGAQHLLCRVGEQTQYFMLEHEVQLDGARGRETILESSRRQPFQPEPLLRFQHGHARLFDRKGNTVVGVFSQDNHILEVYNQAQDRLPVFVFEIGTQPVDALLAKHLLYSVRRSDKTTASQPTLSVQSTLLAGTVPDSDATQAERVFARSLIQSFALPKDEDVLHICPRTMDPNHTESGCFVVTSHGIYDCRPIANPEQIFQAIFQAGQDPDTFGAALGLDLSKLYSQLADSLLHTGDFSKALDLCKLARKPHSDIIRRFTEANQMDLVIGYLRQVLANSALLTAAERKWLSDVLFLAYAQAICDSSEAVAAASLAELDEDDDESEDVMADLQEAEANTTTAAEDMRANFSRYIVDNLVYDQGTSTVTLLNYGLLDFFLEVAEARSLVSKALNMPINHGSPSLNASCRKLLLERGYADAVCECHSGVVLRCMPQEEAIRFVVERANNMLRCMEYATAQLPYLSENSLLLLARYFDPCLKQLRAFLSTLAPRPRSMLDKLDVPLDTPEISVQNIIEMFIRILIAVSRQRRISGIDVRDPNTTVPWMQQPQKALRAVFEVIRPDTDTCQDGDGSSDELPSIPELEQRHASPNARVACGSHHGVVLRGTEVYTWGKASSGRLGHGDIVAEAQRSGPQRVETLHMLGVPVLSVACGSEHVVVRCPNGLFAWGSNSHGQLGLGNTSERTRPVHVSDLDVEVEAIACGRHHSLAISSDGSLWAWGWGEHGQLGTGRTMDVLSPTKISMPTRGRIVDVSAGTSHTAVLTVKGVVLTFGHGRYGQLGHGSTTRQLSPKVVEALSDEPCRLVACGPQQTFFVTFKDRVLQCGRSFFDKRSSQASSSRRKGAPPSVPNITVPKPCECSIPARKIQGLCCGSRHALLITDDGLLASWGIGESGQLGHENKLDCSSPKLIQSLPDSRICHIAAGEAFSVAVDEDEQVWVWGSGRAGELGMDCVLCAPMLLPDLPPLRLETLLPSANGQDFMASSMWTMGRTPPSLNVSSKRPQLAPISDAAEDLPSLDVKLEELSPPYGSWSLPMVLTTFKEFFSVSSVLRWAQDFDDPDTQAHVHALCGDFGTAFNRRVDALLNWTQRACIEPESRRTVLQEKITALTEAFLQLFYVAAAQAEEASLDLEDFDLGANVHPIPYEKCRPHVRAIFARLSGLWQKEGFAAVDFERLVLEHAAVSVPVVLQLLKEKEGGILSQLSAVFYLKLGRFHCTESVFDGAAAFSGAAAPEQRLWSSIIRNIAKDIQARASATVLCIQDDAAGTGSGPDSKRSPASSDAAEGPVTADTVVFTCGHDFSRKIFTSSVIPELRRRLQNLPAVIPRSSAVLVQEYLKQRPSLACPHCLFAALRRRFINEEPTASIPAWIN